MIDLPASSDAAPTAPKGASAMTDSLTTEEHRREDSDGLARLLQVLERQHSRPEAMAGFFAGIGARGVVMALATVMAGPPRDDVAGWHRMPDLLRDGLHAAASWPDFDSEGFGADLAELLRDEDERRRETVSAVTSFLLASGRYDVGLLGGWSRAFDELRLPGDLPLTWASFLTGVDAPQPWTALAAAARDRVATDGPAADPAR